MESEKIPDADEETQRRLIHGHVEAIRARVEAAAYGANIITIVEGNMDWVIASRICRIINHHKPCAHMKHPGRAQLGICTTSETKIDQVTFMRGCIRNTGIVFADDLVCIGDSAWMPHRPERGRASILRALRDQFNTYRHVLKQAKDVFGSTKGQYTGKIGAKQDDLIMALMIGCYFGHVPLDVVRMV